MNNIENVDRWRKAKGNDIRKIKYHYIRSFGVQSREADKFKYQSIKNIIKFLFINDLIEDTIKSNNELLSLINE